MKLEENEILAADPTALNEVRAMIYEFVDVFSVPTASIDCRDKATFSGITAWSPASETEGSTVESGPEKVSERSVASID